MVQCLLGTERKPGQPDWVWLTSAFILGIITASFGRIGAALGFMIPGDAIYSADDLCAEEPVVPDFPTAAQWAGAINQWPADVIIVWEYVKAIVWQFFWEGHCQCVGLTGCPSYTYVITNSWPVAGSPFQSALLATVPIPAGATGYNRVYTAYSFTGAQTGMDTLFKEYSGATFCGQRADQITTGAVPITKGPSTIFAGNPDTIQVYLTRHNSGTGTAGCTITFNFTGPCTEGREGEYEPLPAEDPVEIPDQPSPVCLTIADLCARLTLIESILRFTDRSVSWLQTSLAPDSWVPGTPHTGLTGSGSFAALDTLGVFVTATVPATWGMTYENPPRLIGAIGSIQWSIDGVPMDSELIHYDEQHIFGAPPATDEIIYNFKPGVVGSVTPLMRFK